MDNGTEFVKTEFVAMLDHYGIRREYTPVGSLKHDGVVERRIAMTPAHELRLDELGAVVRAEALHEGRDTLGIDLGQKTSEDLRDVGLPPRNTAIPAASSRLRSSSSTEHRRQS